MKILIFGGGDMAHKGILPIVGGETLNQTQCDVREPGAVFNAILNNKPDVVIVTAGVSSPSEIKMPLGYKDEIETNLIGSFNVAAAAAMCGVGTMIFIGSVAGKYGKPNHAGYSASKAGVISLVQSLGMEGHNAYCISPGRVDTKMRQIDYPDDKPGTRLEPIEIGEVVKDILYGKYKPGDNIIIRRIGFETAPIKIDEGEPWREELKVGQPKEL